MERIYALAHGPEDSPTIFYVGKTSQSVEQRFAQHVRGFNDPFDSKRAYDYWRHLPDDVEVRAILLDTTDTGLTEQDYVRALILEGHPLTNANLGNSKVAKKRSKSTFSELNKLAEERLESIERRKRLHGEAQTLNKPEIVRQRVTNGIVDADTLAEMDWRKTAPELMKWGRPLKNPDEIDCQMLKFGDVNIFVAFKKGKWSSWCHNTRNGTADSYKVSWRTAPKGFDLKAACKRIVEDWPKMHWWPMGKD